MDRSGRSSAPLPLVAAMTGAAVLSPVALVLAINGLLLGILLLPVFPLLALGSLAAINLRRASRPGRASAARPAAVPSPLEAATPLPGVALAAAEAVPYAAAPLNVAPADAAASVPVPPAATPVAAAALDAVVAPVRLRVTFARGVCPVGYRYEAGTEYVFLNGEVNPAFCPVARRALTPLIAQVRRGEIPTTLKPFCKTAVHEVVFEFALGKAAGREKEPAAR